MKKLWFIPLLFCLFLAVHSCEETPETPSYELTPDPTDYTADIPAMRQFYENNPIMYFAEYGLPAIARQAAMEEAAGQDPYVPFFRILDYFNQQMVMEAMSAPYWNPEFINKMQEFPALPLDLQWVETIRYFAAELDVLLVDNPTDPRVGQLHMYLGDGLNYAVGWEFFSDVNFADTPSTAPEERPNELCICEMGSIFPVVASCEAPPAPAPDDNATIKQDWEEVRNPYNTSKDGMCSTLATGLCLKKLGRIGAQVDGKTWNEISCAIKAKSTGGAFNHNINDYYRSLGYGVTVVYDGWGTGSKTAVEQVRDALARGCDAKIVYNNGAWIGGKQHIEYVRNITIDPDDNTRATVGTVSWGDNTATVIFDSDTYSNKSDGALYGEKSYLNQTGKSWFIIYCKK